MSSDATLLAATSHPDDLYQDLVGPGSLQASFSPNVASVPEPSSILLLLAGLGGIGMALRRRVGRLA